ncbi:hypothetical protein [Bacillus sp. MUM 116]|uniref:hypothetical protein n=1 Tax=Bacillus sp. MUM 116 TaxID=1678002 RepID=UPI0015A518E7|nr:hypothetical protein [Bacillus sp. MUM 116]
MLSISLSFYEFCVILIHSFPVKGEIELGINVLSRFAAPFFFSTAGFFFSE